MRKLLHSGKLNFQLSPKKSTSFINFAGVILDQSKRVINLKIRVLYLLLFS